MWEAIKLSIEEQNFDKALQQISDITNQEQVELFILKSEIYYAKRDFDKMFEVLRSGLALAPRNHELYYMLGLYYLEKNVDQAFLCVQNALFYCTDTNDQTEILTLLDSICANYEIHVRKTAIVIVSFNSCYLLTQTIESIRNTLPKDSFQIVVVDNASTTDVIDYLNSQKDIHLIHNTANMGFSHACNQGCAEYEDSDIFLLNNDTRLALNSLFWLKMGLYENEKVAACGSLSNYAGNNQQIEQDFDLPAEYLSYAESINLPMLSPYEERVRLSAFAMLIRHGLWQKVGGMDEIFTPGYFEDDDLSMKLRTLGYHLYLCHNSYIYHAGSQSFSLRPDIEELLSNNHHKFIQKYGFDILQYAYGTPSYLEQIPYSTNAFFNALVLGSSLGADCMLLKKFYPNIYLLSVESNPNLYKIMEKDPTYFPSLSELGKLVNTPLFHVVCINHQSLSSLSSSDLSLLKTLCRSDCKMIHLYQDTPEVSNDAKSISNNITTQQSLDFSIDFCKVKLIVWDLDDTFWQGTLSEGNMIPLKDHIQLIKDLTDSGIINSISSKNELSQVLETLEKLSIKDYFVFNNINWNNKGEQLKQKIDSMFLRPENVLFIDDNLHNLNEANYLIPELITATPDIIPMLISYVSTLPKKDTSHSRLAHYQLLEKKNDAMTKSINKSDFLMQCNISISIHKNCLEKIDRIADLVRRTNQLNYTKLRDSAEILTEKCQNPIYDCGYITANDRYGDYGIVGFFCLDTRNDELDHFLFSCRVIGMGIEQYVYIKLGCPSLSISLPVAVELTDNNTVTWIKENKNSETNKNDDDTLVNSIFITKHSKPKILLKGPCDMSAISSYLIGGDVTCEFNYVNQQGFITAGQNHSRHLKISLSLSPEELSQQISKVPFLDSGDFYSNLFKEPYDVICYSLLPDCHTGIYEKQDGSFSFSFGSKNFDLTDPKFSKGYIDGTLPNHGFSFTEEILSEIRRDWVYKGCLSVEEIIENIYMIKDHVLGNPLIILLIGSEIEYTNENEEFKNHAIFHKEVNEAIKSEFKNYRQIKIVDTTSFIHSQNDYMDCINHYSRNVYYDLATEIVNLINNYFA